MSAIVFRSIGYIVKGTVEAVSRLIYIHVAFVSSPDFTFYFHVLPHSIFHNIWQLNSTNCPAVQLSKR